MGERLNIEIINNGKTLANCYYHWSGYSNSAAELASIAIKSIDKLNPTDSDLVKAIRILESTGAGLTDKGIDYVQTLVELKDTDFKETTGRNDGLIGILPDEINETRYWQEHALYLYLDEQRMSYKVFWKTRRWEYEKECREDEDMPKFDDLEKIDINFDDIKFSEIDKFVEFIENHLEDAFVTYIEPCEVIKMIY